MANELLIHNAEEKLKREMKSVNGREASVIKDAVVTALLNFCGQSSEFAQAIMETDKTFSECMMAVTRNVGNCISDIEAYRRAVAFYFDGADIEFNMTINLSASVEGNENSGELKFSLLDLM